MKGIKLPNFLKSYVLKTKEEVSSGVILKQLLGVDATRYLLKETIKYHRETLSVYNYHKIEVMTD